MHTHENNHILIPLYEVFKRIRLKNSNYIRSYIK